MNRRLHNSFLALLASASTLALCLAMALPAPQQPQARPIALNVGPVEFTFTPADPTASAWRPGRGPRPQHRASRQTRSKAWPTPPP